MGIWFFKYQNVQPLHAPMTVYRTSNRQCLARISAIKTGSRRENSRR